jgi:GAF domain-containing protein
MTQLEEREAEIARTFADIARKLQRADSPEESWQQIVDLAGDVLPSFEHAGVSILREDGKIDSPAVSDDVPPTVDLIQYQENEGPCLSAIREQEMFVTGDLARERRWPRFSTRAVQEAGVRSMLCFQLFSDEENLGALNLYSEQVDAFDERAEALGCALAAHASVGMYAAGEHQEVEQLEVALENSREIGMALGLMMAQSHIDSDRAFRGLSQASQRMNIKLRDLAASIVRSHNDSAKVAS